MPSFRFDPSINSHQPSQAKHTAACQHDADCAPRVAVIILNIDAKSHIRRLLQSLARVHCSCFDVEIIVVDNGSTDGSVAVIQQELKNFRRAHLILNQENLGAAQGRNQALKYALESSAAIPPKYILTLDNDTTVDRQVIEDLVLRAETSRPEEWVFAPLLHFAQEPERLWTSWWTDGWRFPAQMEADWGLRDLYNNHKSVDGVATAAALIKTEAFIELGYFDERLFFGYEDVEWFQRVRRRGYEIKLVRVEGKVLHDCHQSLGGSKKGILSPMRIYYLLRNMVLMMTLYSHPARLRPIQFVKLGRHICLYSLRTLRTMNWQGFRAIWAGLYDGLRRRTGAGRGASFQSTSLPAELPGISATTMPISAYLYFFVVGLITTTLTVLYALTIDWTFSNVFIAGFATFAIGYLIWGVADVITQLLFLIGFRLLKGPLQCRRVDMSDGIPTTHRTIVAYMLRSNHGQECDEAFDNMYRSYMDNLDINGNLTAVLVSASTSLSVVQHEMDLRDNYRDRIRSTLLAEAEIHRNNCLESVKLSNDYLRADFWSRLFGRWKQQGYTEEKLEETIEALVERVVRGFKYIHRTSTTLKKAGQYQDLMLLGSRGIDRPFTYLEEKYGNRGRSPEVPVFGFCSNLVNDQALLKHEFEQTTNLLEARGMQDIMDLKYEGQTYGTSEDISYRYTVLLDADNRVPADAIRSLVEIAAANPERGFFQSGLLGSNMDTWHAFREILSHHTVSKMPEAQFRAFGRFGNYGKGLADNDVFIEQFIGTPQAPRETLPLDILSHDTIEALYLNPAYVPQIFFYEAVSSNAFSRQAQQTRWTQGDLMNAVLLMPKSFGRAFVLAKKLFGNSYSDNLSNSIKAPAVPYTAHYIAHFSSRALLRAPLFFLWIFIETFGQAILIHTNPVLMKVHFYFIVFGLVLLPKMYKPSLKFIAGVRFAFLRQRSKAIRNMESAFRGFIAAWLEILTTPFVHMPDVLFSPLRLWLAMKSLLNGQATWKVQAEVERETQHISFMGALKNTWGYTAIALAFSLALWSFEASVSILLIALLTTWLVFPVTVWLGAKTMSTQQRNNAWLLWILKDFDQERLWGSEANAREPGSVVVSHSALSEPA